MMIFGKLLIAFGFLLIVHAGYYSVQYAEYLHILEITDAQNPPLAVIFELLLAFLITLSGVLVIAGEVQPIRSNNVLHSRSLATLLSVPDFHVFNHRGKALQKRIIQQ